MNTEAICSVIIVSFNNFDTATGPCLQSLLRDDTAMEIVVVDNNSDTYTRSQLKHISETDSRIHLQLNNSNRGYAGGNNDGVHVATTDIVILLNNDTVVPVGTIKKFAELLKKNPQWDMLGPVTNSCGNEQQIYTSGKDVEDILIEGEQWCRHSDNFFIYTDLLGFFCVAIRKEIYETLQGLDEEYGLGFYEDTDFCYRAQQNGMKMVITDDIFIYHQGSATFAKIALRTKQLMKVNRKLFRRKHGTSPDSLHVRERNLNLLERYRALTLDTNDAHAVFHKAKNRLLIAEQLKPNSPIKRFFYNQRLRPLQHYFSNIGAN